MIRGGIKYTGQGSIAVGGGDEVWLAINNTLLIELVSDPTHTLIKCKRVDISGVDGDGKFVCVREGMCVRERESVCVCEGECVYVCV